MTCAAIETAVLQTKVAQGSLSTVVDVCNSDRDIRYKTRNLESDSDGHMLPSKYVRRKPRCPRGASPVIDVCNSNTRAKMRNFEQTLHEWNDFGPEPDHDKQQQVRCIPL